MENRGSRLGYLLSGLIGGLAALALGGGLIAADVIEVGDTTRVVEQAPISQPAPGGDDDDRSNGGSTVSEIYRRVGPGVVFVEARRSAPRPSPFGFGPPDDRSASGSGFVLDRDGYILTNAHVVAGSRSVDVRFGEGDDAVEAELVGSDLSTDLAVVKVDPDEADLKPLTLGDSKRARVGDPAIAIGNPFGFDRTVTTGIVSALQRQIQAPNGFSIENVIQTDASINPGNSGGPLLDANGRVIGINSQIATSGGGSVGIGFAVPINTAKSVVPQLKDDGKVERAYLGVTTAPVTKRIAEDLNLPASRGALIQDVVDGGPADKAGLRAGRTRTSAELTAGGDLIVKVDGEDIGQPADVASAIADDKPGDRVVIEFFRGDDRRKVTVRLGKRPESALAGPDARRRGAPEPELPDDLLPFP